MNCSVLVEHTRHILENELKYFKNDNITVQVYDGPAKNTDGYLLPVEIQIHDAKSESSFIYITFLCKEYNGFYQNDRGVQGSIQFSSSNTCRENTKHELLIPKIISRLNTFQRLYMEDEEGSGAEDCREPYYYTKRSEKKKR